MLALILGFITGLAGPIAAIAGKITDLKLAQTEARTNIERAKIDADIEAAHDRKAVLVAEAGQRIASTLNASMRFCLALGPMLILLKFYAWDKVVGSFSGCAGRDASFDVACKTFRTDPLDANQWAVITAVIAFYFLYDLTARFKR